MGSGGVIPLLIIFGVDNTLWPKPGDAYFKVPYSKTSNGSIIDSLYQIMPPYYTDVPEILHKLKQKGIKIAVTESDSYLFKIDHIQLLKLRGFDVSHPKMLPTYKISESLEELKNATNIDYTDMMFFGQSDFCLIDAEKLGITSFYMPGGGMTIDIFEIGIRLFQKLQPRRKSKEKPRRGYMQTFF